MLKKLARITGDIYRWKIWLRLPSRVVHTHIEVTAEKAHEIYSELLNEKARHAVGLNAPRKNITVLLSTAAAEYQKHLVVLGKNSKHVLDSERSVTLLLKIAGSQATLQDVSRQMLQEWQSERYKVLYRKKAPSARTVNKSLAEVSAFLSWCQERDWIDKNPAFGMKRQQTAEPPLRYITWTDFCKFADKAWEYRPAMALVIEVAAETGGRIGEVIAAKVQDIDVQRRIWSKVVKGNKRISIRAGDWTMEAVNRAKGKPPDSPLCPREDGLHFRYNALERAIPLIAEKAGIQRITAHYMRHGRATWDVDAGMTARSVQKQLGHSAISTTERYFKASEGISEQQNTTKRKVRVVMCSKTRYSPNSSPRSTTIKRKKKL